MPNYSNGKIYTIRFANDDRLVYVGSTIQSLSKRLYDHKTHSSSSVFQFVEQDIDQNWDNCYIELYELYPCETKDQLCKREGEIIRKFKNDSTFLVINLEIAGRTRKEYYMENKQKILDKAKMFYQANKESILTYSKIKYTKEKRKKQNYNKNYYIKNQEILQGKAKEYVKQNKESILLKSKDRYQKNKHLILEDIKVQVKCECGTFITKQHLARHRRTEKHNKKLQTVLLGEETTD